MRIEKFVTRWRKEGVVDSVTASRILEFESKRGKFSFGNMLIRLAGLAIFLGVAAIIGSNWDLIPASVKIGVHAILNGGVAFALFRYVQSNREKTVWFDLLIALLAGLTLTFIALVGQVYQTQEPTWKALALWLALATPFWLGLAETKKTVRLWILAFIAFYAFFVFDGPVSGLQSRALLGTLLPFAMIALGQSQRLRQLREVTLRELSFSGFILIVIGASVAQIFWRIDGKFSPADIAIFWNTALAAWVAALAIIVARYYKILVPHPQAVDVLLILSVFVAAVPFLIPHGEWEVMGAVVVMAYWALCGWVGMKAGYPFALTIASTLIALRLIVVYIEVFGSLLHTGVGLVLSGVLLLALVWGTRRAVAYLGAKK
jgi:uncharacterized membrane protein